MIYLSNNEKILKRYPAIFNFIIKQYGKKERMLERTVCCLIALRNDWGKIYIKEITDVNTLITFKRVINSFLLYNPDNKLYGDIRKDFNRELPYNAHYAYQNPSLFEEEAFVNKN